MSMEEIAKLNGFTDAAEMQRLVSDVDISTPEKLAKFEQWKFEDGSKRGLLALTEE